jgi:glycosyltransferase involved in cell wall biosynthesis
MKWFVVAPFSLDEADPWLGRFVPPGRHNFQSVPSTYHHDRSRKVTSKEQWLEYFKHANRAIKIARHQHEKVGFITNFPQLPLTLGCLQQLSVAPIPTLAWSFNIGVLPDGIKRKISQLGLRRIRKFVVHSRAEINACSNWLDLPEQRFEFVPLQRPVTPKLIAEDTQSPFIVAMGSAGRDYALLFQVLAELRYRTVVVAGRHAVEGLAIPSNVEVKSNLSISQCHELLQRSKLSVTPISNTKTASGQISFIDAMNFSKAQVVTRCPGSVDYLDDGEQALLVDPGDFEGLKKALARLWEDDFLRDRLAQNARKRMIEELSDEAAGRHLGRLLDGIEDTNIGAGIPS